MLPAFAKGRPKPATRTAVRHRSGGPRPDVLVPPLDLSGLGRRRATRAVRFMESLHVPKGKGARSRLRLREWQKEIVRKVLAPGIRTAVVAIPRGNGKSTLAAALGLWALVDGPEGAEIPIVAGVSERQARIAFNTARRMVELAPELVARVQIFQDRLYMPHHDASLFPLPADADALLGANPTKTIVDELGVIDAEVFEAMRLVSGKRAESTLLAIGTPPREPDSIMRTLVEHGRLGDDPTFSLIEYAAPDGCEVDDRQAWKTANPALGDFLYEDGMATEAKTVRESTFRQFRLGQWIASPEEAWMAPETWAACSTDLEVVDDTAEVVLGLDGSFSQDCTALVGCTVTERPHVFVVGCWENPSPGDDTFRIDVQEVEAMIRESCRRWHVLEVTADPYRWTRTLQVLADERIPASEFPQSPSRMTPATTALYEAIVNGTVSHDGDQRLARHVTNAVLKADSRGTRLVKEHKYSRHRIDLAIAAVMAHDRARHHAVQPRAQIFVLDR
jgi:phage terminase large subunit-like protein